MLAWNTVYLTTVGYVVIQAPSHHSNAPLNMPPSMRLGTASHNAPPFHDLRAPLVDDSAKKDTRISSNAEIEKFTLKDDCAIKSEKITDQRALKLRIKVKSDILGKKNAAIYSGLGLDNSPSSSMGNSPEESEVMPPISKENPEESPTSIVRVEDLFYFYACKSIDIRNTDVCGVTFMLFDATGYDILHYPWRCANITST